MKKFIFKVAQVLFSVWVWSASFVIMLFSSTMTILLTFFMPFQKVHTWLSAPSMGLCVRLTFSKFRIIYDPEFDPKRTGVYCSNHTNLLDAHVACATIPGPFCGLMDAWHFKIPGYGWMMKVSKGIPVQRRKRTMLAEMIETAKIRNQEGMSILVFPEAHRTTDGTIRKFRRGVFVMARDAGYPVVPLAVRGMYDVNRKGSLLFKPGNVTVYVGKQFETAGKTDEELEALAEEVRQVMIGFVQGEETQVSLKGEAA